LAKEAELAVEDSGPGVPAEIRHRIFDPFFTTKDVGKGTGQGLAIAHRIIHRQHGGTLTVEDSALGGARFVIRLPLRPVDEVEAPAVALLEAASA
jgi:signal transduction histidine kinase